MARLTKTFIDSQVPPPRGQVIIRDDLLPGFGLRITPNCKSFIVEGRIEGKARRMTLGKYDILTPEIARRQARRILAEWKLGIDITGARKVDGPTVAQVLERYQASKPLKDATKLGQSKLVQRLIGDWLSKPIGSITKDMIRLRHRELVRPTRCGTDNKACANTVMQLLNSLIRFAAENFETTCGSLLKENPVSLGLRHRWYKIEARNGVIPDHRLPDFFKAVMSSPSKIARDFILLLLFAGVRRGEAASLKWSYIDFDNCTLSIPAETNKSSRELILPLTPLLIALLSSRSAGREQSEYVFPGRDSGHINEPRGQLATLRKKMGWHWLLHDLRRTFLSTGEKAGVPYIALQKLANHVVERGVTDRYLVVDVEYLRPHMAMIHDRLLNLMGVTVSEWQILDSAEVPPRTPSTQKAEIPEEDEEEIYW